MREIVIVGAGPAGLSCALFLAKAGRDICVVDSGQTIIRRANLKNYLGFPGGIPGNELVARGKEQIEELGGAILTGRPITIEIIKRGFKVTVADQQVVTATKVVLATGMSIQIAEQLGIPVIRGTYANRIIETDVHGHTVLPNVWATGVVAGTPVQAIIAAGDGARVAVNILSEIRGSIYMDHDVLPSERRSPSSKSTNLLP
ncbi:MAG: pyridine nucleotide-disulfide oxidoreductase [Sulfobacillus thermosulfidooxidans]|uniref:Pyridine nucleotide-disulfide oxidoreductase n=1 Tax=Sulfobacillus thermosulfidooxidans TaxID=28034 RepID=A0A2T2WQJ3_SULTH|nr:MAG: pyridine nucleotide-disulfide oxidoreductase [Sulfobacillus thermosulfidooxidans]